MDLYYNVNSASMSVISCFVVFSISLIIPLTTAAAAKNGSGLTIDLIHPDSQISPLFNPSETRFDRARKSVINSFNRHKYFKSLLMQSPATVDAPIHTVGIGFVMRVGIGTPPRQIWAIADTGSDLSWAQCTPCNACFKQDDPLFNPSYSSSYKKISCYSDQCQFSSRKSCSGVDDCAYSIFYGDQSRTRGTLAMESFTFSSGGNAVTFKNVIFGCCHDNVGTFIQKMSGIIGLGGGDDSIVRQLDMTFAGKFAYCVTSPASNATSKISFGKDAVIKGSNKVSTPILTKKSKNTSYFLSLESITVGNKKLSLKSSDGLPTAPAAEGNVIIDSGSTITLLPKDLYEKVAVELKKAIKAKPVKSQQNLPLCYKVPSKRRLNPPPVTAHFKGADVLLPEEGIFLELKNGVVCVTFAPARSFGIFGNMHQVNYLVGYDMESRMISFQKTDCSNFGRPERN